MPHFNWRIESAINPFKVLFERTLSKMPRQNTSPLALESGVLDKSPLYPSMNPTSLR